MSEKVEIIAELKDLVSGKFKEINSQIDAMDKKLSSLNSVGIGGGKGIMGQVLGANLLTGAIQRAGSAIVDFGKDSFTAFGKQEQFQTALTTLLHGNADQANALNNQLKTFAIQTPFELTEIRDATKLMIAYGSNAGSVVDEMRMLGDVSSGVGSSLGEVAYLYGTLRTQGRAFSKDIYQFTGRGIPIVKQLAKQFNVADSAVMKLVEDGKVGFREIEKAFQSMTSTGGQFSGMMEQQSKTLLGQTSNLADAWDQLKEAIGRSQQGILKDTISWATKMVGVFKDFAEKNNYIDEAFGKGAKGFNSMNSKWAFGNQEADKRYSVYDPRTGKHKLFESEGIRDAYLEYNKTGNPELTSGMSIGGNQRFTALADNLYERFQSVSKNDDIFNTKKLGFISDLTKQRLSARKEVGNNTMSSDFFANTESLINQLITDTKSLISLKATADKNNGKEPSKLETLAKQNKATQIIVNIENFVREYTNNFNSPDQAKEFSVRDAIQAFISGINDIYAVGQ